MAVSPRYVGLGALLALLPVGVYLASRSDPLVALALVNVVLIAASLAVALSEVDGHAETDAETNDETSADADAG